VKYQILGPVRVEDNGGYSFIRARKIETILVILLVRADLVVTLDQLIDELWGTAPPRRATAGLHVYISQLRKFLQQSGLPDTAIETRPPGYLLHVGPENVDFQVFLKSVERGRVLIREHSYEEAGELLTEALGMWRGPVFGDLPVAGPLLEGFATWMVENRLECLEMLYEAQLESGRHREIVGALYSAVAENPLRETFYRQLMAALYRSERRADALKVYRTLRAVLNEELGLEPCRALRELNQAIVTGADEMLLPSRTAATR
jgi:DNA-binding SARP family transcriptional activator